MVIFNSKQIHPLRKGSLSHTSEYESVPPVYDSLINQKTSQSFWVLGEDGAYVRNHPRAAAAAEMLHRQIQTSTGHTGEKPISYQCPCVLYLFLTVTNGSAECRPGVNTHLQMTRVVVEDMQRSSKNLECRTQCSREKDQNNKRLAVSADENGTHTTLETIFSGLESPLKSSIYIRFFY